MLILIQQIKSIIRNNVRITNLNITNFGITYLQIKQPFISSISFYLTRLDTSLEEIVFHWSLFY